MGVDDACTCVLRGRARHLSIHDAYHGCTYTNTFLHISICLSICIYVHVMYFGVHMYIIHISIAHIGKGMV